jgi:phage FluMu gp28-like protein
MNRSGKDRSGDTNMNWIGAGMPVHKDELETGALKLPPADRAHLAHRLIESLEGAGGGDFKAKWIEEAEQRHAEYRKGLVAARDASQVFQDARIRLE